MQDPTTIKRIKIVIAYLILIGLVSLAIYFIKTPASTCFDKMQNQGEKGIDCGGPCAPCMDIGQTKDLIIQEVAAAPGCNNTYDVVAKISNQNDSAGAESFKYVFTLEDASGTIVATKEGTSFILPSDTKYVAQLEIATDNNATPENASIAISDVKWGKLSGIGKPQLGVYSKKFGAASVGSSSEAEGIIRNESGYDLKKIEVVIVVRDEKGDVIGINLTQRDSVRAKEEQKFNVTWPYPLDGNVQKMEVDPQVNIFDSQNFSVAK